MTENLIAEDIFYRAFDFLQSNISAEYAEDSRPLSTTDSSPIYQVTEKKKRVSKACDQCKRRRSRCSGTQPCERCLDEDIVCAFAYPSKKRGKVPKTKSTKSSIGSTKTADTCTSALVQQDQIHDYDGSHTAHWFELSAEAGTRNQRLSEIQEHQSRLTCTDHQVCDPLQADQDLRRTPQHMIALASVNEPGVDIGSAQTLSGSLCEAGGEMLPAKSEPSFHTLDLMSVPRCEMKSGLHYPVLRPILQHIHTMMTHETACQLLEDFFSCEVYGWNRSVGSHLLTSIFRRASILDLVEPRMCSPSVLAGMLLVPAQLSCEGFGLPRSNITQSTCDRLFYLAMNSGSLPSEDYLFEGMNATGGSYIQQGGIGECRESYQAQVDNVVTHICLATAVTVKTNELTSLAWWDAASILASNYQMGFEASIQEPVSQEIRSPFKFNQNYIDNEVKEERRRVWWLLYIQDRHLAMSFDRQMRLRNEQCKSLSMPIDDTIWQADGCVNAYHNEQPKGLDTSCFSASTFGIFLPLAVISGEIFHLKHTRMNLPVLPTRKVAQHWTEVHNEILAQLKAYDLDLADLQGRHTSLLGRSSAMRQVTTPDQLDGINDLRSAPSIDSSQQKMLAYGRFAMYALYMLLSVNFSDNDLSFHSFSTAMEYVYACGTTVSDLLRHDPNLSLMALSVSPHLLHLSLVLDAIADKLPIYSRKRVEEVRVDVLEAYRRCKLLERACS